MSHRLDSPFLPDPGFPPDSKPNYQIWYWQNQGWNLEMAVEKAVTWCIRHDVMAEWLSGHRAEVVNVLLTEYDEQKHMRLERKEAMAKGRAEGKVEGNAETILEFLKELGEIPPELHKVICVQTNLDLLSNG